MSRSDLLRLESVSMHYPVSRPLPIGPRRWVRALDDVDVVVHQGEALGVMGESGCGKSTLTRVMTGLERPTSGRVLFEGRDVTSMSRSDRREMARNVQLIFQDPYSALNPRKTVARIVEEPFLVHGLLKSATARRRRVLELLELVGLKPDHADRRPHEFSGGQQQRIGIARGIALNPRLLVCDEPVSALDVSVRAQVVNLLQDLQDELSLSYVFVAHDLQILRHISHRVATMYLGQMVEVGPTEEVFRRTSHPYARSLLAAAPELRYAGESRAAPLVQGDPPSPIDPPGGCRFRTRCPLVEDVCHSEPDLAEASTDHVSRCHFRSEVQQRSVDELGTGTGPEAPTEPTSSAREHNGKVGT